MSNADMSDAEVLFERQGVAGIITLNRPKALNSLTLNMVRLIHPQLEAWAGDEAVKLVIIRGAGEKAFCAGGDIRALHDWGKAGDKTQIDFYREEYRLNRLIKTFPKPYVALMDGINMGGGVGLSVHGSHRVATERTLFAMPETGIGLFPDVGGTFFLPRCPGEVGMYLALTGTRIKAADCLYAGIADAYVPSEKLDVLTALAGGEDPASAIAAHREEAGEPSLAEHRAAIDTHFSKSGVTAILTSLDEDRSGWAAETAKAIRAKSPLSTKVAYAQVREGAGLDFDACMKLEFRLTNRFMAGHDFYEGVRAVVIDKDQAPKWEPATLKAVTDDMVRAYFASLGPEELTF
ncbi:enoyl-CoA hydratase/isomerase family protein [Tepidicaulis sp. LMO-SS28]|uniref:enoyl-CoA hydratase/isomerase family protein n=1 Tax=Tepidicaulis sp. LMO-SS28 TaxID=3447455 RepID=UPI003EE149CC